MSNPDASGRKLSIQIRILALIPMNIEAWNMTRRLLEFRDSDFGFSFKEWFPFTGKYTLSLHPP
jgi:hypothetical protein